MAEQYDEEARRRRRAQRREEMRRRKKRQELFRKIAPIGLAAVCVLVAAAVVTGRGRAEEKPDEHMAADEQIEKESGTETGKQTGKDNRAEADGHAENETKGLEPWTAAGTGRSVVMLRERFIALEEEKKSEEKKKTFRYEETADTLRPGDEITSGHVIFVSADDEIILAGRDEMSRVVPASMTKVLTLLVALENIDDLDDEFVITTEITDYCFLNDCSVAGYEAGEKVTVRDLLYGAILPSGGDGALGLAIYTAGSHEAFVELMNEKLAELGLSGTAHFTNCIGIYDENHYCTVYDMAVIMEAAMQNEMCREILSTRIYTTSRTEQHPEGIELSNWFLRRIEDKDTGGMTMYGKTGYVVQSGNCAVSCGIDKEGKKYICVTSNGVSRWRCIEDHAYLYKLFSAS